MRKINLPFLLSAVTLLAVLLFISYGAPNTVDTKTYHPSVYSTIFSLVPPVIAIGLALITREVYSSLFVGIVVGGLLAANFSAVGTVNAVVQVGIVEAVKGTAGIFVFLVILGVFVALMNMAGGSAAFGRWAQTHIKTKIG